MVKILFANLVLFLLCFPAIGQELINREMEIGKNIKVSDTIDLPFVDSPSAGMHWKLYSDFDSTIISIKLKSYMLMAGDFPKGGRYIETIQCKALKPGSVVLDFYYGRVWLKEKLSRCRVEIKIQ